MKHIVLIALLVLSAWQSYAKYTQTSQIKYETQDGWSKTYTVNVTYISGRELNDATTSMKYNYLSTYAVIFWDENQVTIIKITDYTGCGDEVTKSCINSFYDYKGIDQEGVHWKITVNY